MAWCARRPSSRSRSSRSRAAGMGMDRLLERLRKGSGPPLRVSEFADLIGYSTRTVRKLIDAGKIDTVGLTEEERIPICEAQRVARDLKILQRGEKSAK